MTQGKIWIAAIGFIMASGSSLAQEGPITFDDRAGQTEFSEEGANFSSGIVLTEGVPALYSSGAFAYALESDDDTATVTFDQPADSATFFFVHEAGIRASHGDRI